MLREFFSIHVDQKTGEEIQLDNFSVFENLLIVKEDKVNVDDLKFLFKSIDQVKGKNAEEINKAYQYFFQRNYPWFYVSSVDLQIE